MKNNRITSLIAAIALSLCSTATAQIQDRQSLALEPGKLFERELEGSEAHIYHLTLAAGECARVELQSASARLSLALLSEKNELLVAISDSDSPGLKQLDIVAEHATQYLIRVAPERSQTTTAKYQLMLVEKRAATAADRERFALHQLDWEVVSLYRQQEKSALQQAADKAREAAARWLALGESERAGRMFDRVGRSLYLLSQHQASQAAYEQAIAAFQQAGARLAEATSLNNLATLSYNSGDYQRMLASEFRALAIWQTAHDEEGLRMFRFQQAYLYCHLGEWQKAEDLCRQLLTEAGTGRLDEWDRVYHDDVLMVRGMVAVRRGAARLGLSYLSEATAPARRARNVIVEVQVLQYLGLAWRALGNQTKALDFLQQACAASHRLGASVIEAETLNDLGRLYVLLGRRDDARMAFSQAVKAAAPEGKRFLSMSLLSLARLQHDQGEQIAALTNVEQALQIIEGLRAQLPLDAARASFLAEEREAYELRPDLLLHLHERDQAAGYDAAALQASEANRARSLVQLLGEKHLLPPPATDPALMVRDAELRLHITALTSEQVRLRLSPASPRRAAVENELASLLAELEKVAAQIRAHNPHGAALTLVAPLTLREIQQQVLDRDTLLLEYELGEERSFLFAVTPETLQTFILPGRAVIEQSARQVYDLLARRRQPKVFTSMTEKQAWSRRNERAYELAAAQLSKLLLKPAAALLGDKRLLIVGDGMLHYVPFAALPDPKDEGGRMKDEKKNARSHPSSFRLHPLVVEHEIIALPSASTFAALRRGMKGRKAAPKTLAVLADPVFDLHDERLASLKQPGPQPGAVTQTAELSEPFRALGDLDGEGNFFVPPLPASRVEAETILALVAPDERKAALDFDASYQTATQGELDQYRFVHIATHGLLDEIHPELSGLLLSQVNRQGGNENGYFTTLDAFNLKLNAELVVLSGCRTALGKEVRGEGLMGLTRGFMYAGARRVMASLWQVNDAATAELMKHFYRGMLGEKKLLPAAALRAAQLEMLKDPRWNAPYYWAAFTLQGEW